MAPTQMCVPGLSSITVTAVPHVADFKGIRREWDLQDTQAVIAFEPAGSADTEIEAFPLAIVPLPMLVVPS